ncbi:MAG: CBS domain-containing protein [Candidatus Promineifilaceae bacterium]|nr:CBS domain-containing protein [Candidatus Promineifilaceae bacterium]
MAEEHLSNAQRFLSAYNEIDEQLHELAGEDRYRGFRQMVDRQAQEHPVVRAYAQDLRAFGELRNIIVHEERDGQLIAEPNGWSVRRIETIELLLRDPPLVCPHFERDVYTRSPDDSLSSAVRAIYRQGFSQVPVFDDRDFVGLLSAKTIARWLGAHADDGEAALTETMVGAVLRYAESEEDYQFVSRETTVVDAVVRFQETNRRGRRLRALLITDDGRPTEQLVGIMTVFDLPQAYALLGPIFD